MTDDEVEKVKEERIEVMTTAGGRTYTGLITKRIGEGWLFQGMKGSERIVTAVRSSAVIFPVEKEE